MIPKSLKKLIIVMAVCAFFPSVSFTQHKGKSLSPEEQVKTFKLPKGFVIELVASEKNGVINPIDISFDDAGRLWTQTARMYPLDPIPGVSFGKAMQMMKDPNLAKKYPKVADLIQMYQLKKKGTDQILIVEDPTKTAQGKLQVWADGLTIPQSIMPYKNGAYVAHGSELFYLSDENNDGKQDKVTPMFTNFGIFDTHTMSHSIVRGPGDWMYFSHGAINSGNVKILKTGKTVNITYSKNARFNLDGTKLEIVNNHRDNNWGYQVRANGQWYATSANDGGFSVLPYEDMMSIPGLGNEKIRPYQPYHPPVHKFRVGGTGISGLAFSEDGSMGFPKEWQDTAFLANPITRKINVVKIFKKTNGAVEANHLPDFLTCSDPWFRPVNIEFGPDGCLYIADWYNKIISHNEVRRDHPERDRGHGRIWRIRHVSQKTHTVPNLTKVKNADLVKHLSADILWEKRAAWHQIVDRKATELAPQIKEVIKDKSKDSATRIAALWSLEGLGAYDRATIEVALKSGDDNLKREAIRTLISFKITAKDAAELLAPYVEDQNALVRSQVLRTLEEIRVASNDTIALLVKACKPAAPNNNLGGNYERNFERFLARKALESYKKELKDFIASPLAASAGTENLLWALQALSDKERVAVFLNIWNKASETELDDNTFVAISLMLSNPEVKKAIAPTFASKADEMLKTALKVSDRINGANIAQFYRNKFETMLNSGDDSQVSSALSYINQLRSPFHTQTIKKLINTKKHKGQLNQLISSLVNDPKLSVGVYREILYTNDLDFSSRLSALAALSIQNTGLAMKDCKKWLPSLSEAEVTTLSKRLSWSPQGTQVVLHLWELGYLDSVKMDYTTSFMLYHRNKSDWRAKQIYDAAMDIDKKERKTLTDKVNLYIVKVGKLKGNIQVGKAIFASCKACHSVNGEGQQLAPPLDGSKNRDVASIITAIMDPSVAFEAVYGLHYAVRKDGFVVEGYLKKSDANGVTIAQVGGNKVFIPAAQLNSFGGVDGRSFMPSTFSGLPAQNLADLAAYIKTIK